jgi:hypothetical protein
LIHNFRKSYWSLFRNDNVLFWNQKKSTKILHY